jgi:hypothetical protein
VYASKGNFSSVLDGSNVLKIIKYQG